MLNRKHVYNLIEMSGKLVLLNIYRIQPINMKLSLVFNSSLVQICFIETTTISQVYFAFWNGITQRTYFYSFIWNKLGAMPNPQTIFFCLPLCQNSMFGFGCSWCKKLKQTYLLSTLNSLYMNSALKCKSSRIIFLQSKFG